MRERVAQCQRLSVWVHDEKTRQALLQMANEVEADARKLQAEEAARPRAGQRTSPKELA